MELVPRVSDIKDVKHILDMTKEEKKTFLNSFDSIFSDCDAVLWWYLRNIPGVPETIKLLEKNGKTIRFISNNSARPFEEYEKKFSEIEVEIKEENLVHPVLSIIHHLNDIKFKGLIYCIGTEVFKNYLRAAGFDLFDGPNEIFKEDLAVMIKNVFDKKSVQAVIIDADMNLSYAKLVKAELYLKYQPECLFIKGATDKYLPVTPEFSFMGPGYFSDALETAVGRDALVFSKPGKSLAENILKQFQIKDPSRYLFIGDMLAQDIAFGTQCGFQKLLVLTGGSTKEHLFAESLPKEQVPDYYADSLADFIKFFENINLET